MYGYGNGNADDDEDEDDLQRPPPAKDQTRPLRLCASAGKHSLSFPPPLSLTEYSTKVVGQSHVGGGPGGFDPPDRKG